GRSRREAMVAVGILDEAAVLAEAEDFLKRELNSAVQVFVEDDERRRDPRGRAKLARPYRPAIYIE
ncbi:MAG: hypothetical protein WCC63_04725, partial [Candidatus Bathyarchaeia archaeon]